MFVDLEGAQNKTWVDLGHHTSIAETVKNYLKFF